MPDAGKGEKVILGIDPGTNHMGFGIIHMQGDSRTLVDVGVLHLNRAGDPLEKLNRIYQHTQELVKVHQPHEAAIEEPFYGKNIQAMLKLGRAQGVAIAAVQSFGIPITQYPPRRVKQSITGNGAASKEQVAAMVLHLLGLRELPVNSLDATDGLAVALCHSLGSAGPPAEEKASGWEKFIKNNPGRIIR